MRLVLTLMMAALLMWIPSFAGADTQDSGESATMALPGGPDAVVDPGDEWASESDAIEDALADLESGEAPSVGDAQFEIESSSATAEGGAF